MSKRIYSFPVLLSFLLLAPFFATAQQPETPVFTFISEWKVPQEKWTEFDAFEEENSRPILERFFADGTIIGYVYIVSRVHHATGNTHGFWFTATSIAGTQRVISELLRLPTNPAVIDGEYHHDHLLQSLLRGGRAGAGSGYLVVNAYEVQPGKGEEWRQAVEKYLKPTWDDLVANGTITYYELSLEHIHTADPDQRYIWYIVPSADAMDKVVAAFDTLKRKRSMEENRAIEAAFRDLGVLSVHRDSLYWVPNFARK